MIHKGRYHVPRLLRVGMRVVVDASGVALYPGNGVTDDGLEKNAVGRPLVGVRRLV